MDGYFITSEDAEQVEMREGLLRRTMATTDEAMICEFALAEGVEVPDHSHMNDQVGYVVSGKIEITVGEQTRTLSPGDSYAVPGGVPHRVIALVDTVTIDIFSPPRNDYRSEAR